MARYEYRTPRLFVDTPLAHGLTVVLAAAQANYLRNVLRLPAGAGVLAFNGRHGEWRAELEPVGKREARLAIKAQTRPQTAPGDLHYLFAPLKHARLDYMVQKAVEMGASRLQPVITRHTQVARVNLARMRANAIEAAQQCGILSLPEINAPAQLTALIGKLDAGRLLVFCDEDAEVKDPVAALAALRSPPTALLPLASGTMLPLALLVGPEGGFSEDERAALMKLPNVVRLALGPRVLRADTAAVAALALIQTVLGDWHAPPEEEG